MIFDKFVTHDVSKITNSSEICFAIFILDFSKNRVLKPSTKMMYHDEELTVKIKC
jgi:hypothetical protein